MCVYIYRERERERERGIVSASSSRHAARFKMEPEGFIGPYLKLKD